MQLANKLIKNDTGLLFIRSEKLKRNVRCTDWHRCVCQARDLASNINRFQNDVHKCVGMIQDPPKLKEQIMQIYFKHVHDIFVRTRVVY